MNVIKPSAPMRSNPNQMSELQTECLFGETLEILEDHLDWYYCKLKTDGYVGWVRKEYLGRIISPSHRVIAKRTFLFKNSDVKSGCIFYLPLGAQICVEDMDDKWAKVYFFESDINKYAYVPSNHIIQLSAKIDDWVSIAENLIGTPYVWGGRDSIGLDCSALLQLSYQNYGENIPRNSYDQSLLDKEIIKDKELIERGFTVFWKGHVAIMTDKINCVHANAYHMRVSKEPLIDVINRTNKNNAIKIMNFN